MVKKTAPAAKLLPQKSYLASLTIGGLGLVDLGNGRGRARRGASSPWLERTGDVIRWIHYRGAGWEGGNTPMPPVSAHD